MRGRLLLAAAVAVAFGAASLTALAPAAANGRFPSSTNVMFRPEHDDEIYLAVTFGLMVSRDDGWHWSWMCEDSIGYGGVFDPKYAVDELGTIFATTYDGLRVSHDGGCTFETATAEAPDGPDKIAGLWVDAIDLASDGTVWVGTAESGLSNAVFRSVDQGETFTRMGLESKTAWWKSLRVAPSDAGRIYVTGYQVAPTPQVFVERSIDGGQSWESLPLDGIELGQNALVLLEAVDPDDPDVLYLRSVNVFKPTGDRLYRSANGGQTWTGVLDTADPLRGVALRSSGDEVLAATVLDDLHRSTDGGQTFARIAPAPQAACLEARADGEVFACGANWDPDYFTLGRSQDGSTWSKVIRFHEMAGPLACPAGTVQHDVCELQQWPSLRNQFAVTGPVDAGAGAPDAGDEEPAGDKGCCESGGGRASLLIVLAVGVGLFWLGRRRRRRSCCN